LNVKHHWNKAIVGLSVNSIKILIDVVGEDTFDNICNELKI
jgi:hypothetical protein